MNQPTPAGGYSTSTGRPIYNTPSDLPNGGGTPPVAPAGVTPSTVPLSTTNTGAPTDATGGVPAAGTTRAEYGANGNLSGYRNPDGSLTPVAGSTATPNRTIYNDPSEPAPVVAKTTEQIQAEKMTASQGRINDLNSYYNTLRNEAAATNAKNARSTNAISSLTGLSGSTEAAGAARTTAVAGDAATKKVENERMVAIDSILSDIQTSAVEEAKQSRLEARQSEADRIAYREKAQAKAVQNLTSLSKATPGLTLEGLKATLKPEEYQHIIDGAGGEALAKAIIFENRAKESVLGTPQLIGGKMVQAYQTPDGKVKYEDIALPAGVNPGNIKSVEKTDNGIFIINNDGTYSRVTGSAKPGTGAGGSGTVANTSPAYKQALSVILGSGKFTKDQKTSVVEAINNGEDPATVIKNQAKNIMGQTEATKVISLEASRDAFNDFTKTLSDYYAAGGKTSYLSGNFEKVVNKLGTVSDPKLVELATQLQGNIQSYRNAISGTAYSSQEGQDINSIFPGINKSESLNTAITSGRKKLFDSSIDGIYRSTLGSSYDGLKTLQSKQAGSSGNGSGSGNTTLLTGPDGKKYDVPNDKVAAFKAAGGY